MKTNSRKIHLFVSLTYLFLLGCGKSQSLTNSAIELSSLQASSKSEVFSDDACLSDAGIVGLEPGSIKLSGGASVQGDVLAEGASVHLSGGASILGKLTKRSGTKVQTSGNAKVVGGITNVNSSSIADYQDFADEMAALSPTMSFNTLRDGIKIKGNGGLNVINIRGNLQLSGQRRLILEGSAQDRFVINIGGDFSLSGGAAIVAAGGMKAERVLVLNFLGTDNLTDLSLRPSAQ